VSSSAESFSESQTLDEEEQGKEKLEDMDVWIQVADI